MKNLKTLFLSLTLLGASSSSALAEASPINNKDVTEIFDPYADPHMDSNNNSFIDALYSLREICENTNEDWLINLCNEADDVIDNTIDIRLDVSNPPNVWDIDHQRSALSLSASFQYLFNQNMIDDGNVCEFHEGYQCFTVESDIGKTTFAFPHQPA